MSTRPKLSSKLTFISLIISILLIVGLMLMVLRYSESKQKLINYWKVKDVVIDGKSIINEFSTKKLSFYSDGKMLLPKHNSYKASLPLKYSRWEYKRKSFVDGQVLIEDTKQFFFSGLYNVDILIYSKPQTIILYSDTVQIYLQGHEGFSLEKQTIEMDWPSKTRWFQSPD